MPQAFEQWFEQEMQQTEGWDKISPTLQDYSKILASRAWYAGIYEFKKQGPSCFDCKSQY